MVRTKLTILALNYLRIILSDLNDMNEVSRFHKIADMLLAE